MIDIDSYMLTIAVIIVLLLVSITSSASETAFLSVSKARLHQRAHQGQGRAFRALELVNNPEQMLTTILLINTSVNAASSALTTMLLVDIFGEVGVAYATVLISFVLLIFAEALPKSFGARFAEPITLAFAPSFLVLIRFCLPLVWLVKALNRGILTLLGLGNEGTSSFTENDLRGAINLGVEHGTIKPGQQRMLDAVLDLDRLTVADVMIHRSAIAALDVSTAPTDIPAVLAGLKHSRVPVYAGTPDNIIGFLSVRDYLGALSGVTNRAQVKLREHIRPISFVPETAPVGHQLLEFLKQRYHLALVVDEYGSLQGLITLEDILEEIVGDIADEHDKHHDEEHLPDGSLRLPGRAAVRDLNRKYGWRLPEDNAVTLAGLMIDVLRHLPAQGESVQITGLTLTVASKRGHRVEWVRVVPPKDAKKKAPKT
jgi:Mg2+/Co2+ transporter CorB